MADNRVSRIKREATARLLAIPGVTAVGIGPKVVGGDHTGIPAIKVFVRVKRPLPQVPAGEVIPAEIDGVPTDVSVGGGPVPAAAVDQPGVFRVKTLTTDREVYRPLVGGGRITTQGGHHGGTGGCLLQDTAHPDAGYLLTNFHVIKAEDIADVTVGVTKVGQPIGTIKEQGPVKDIIGVFAGGNETGVRDEAVVRLDPGTEWQAQIEGIGLVAGTHTVTLADITVAGKPYRVAKRGQESKVTGGTVHAIEATTGIADNLIVVSPNPDPRAGDPGAGGAITFFLVRGDSGSALVNAANEVVGLLFAFDKDDPGLGLAYPIDHVLQRLQAVDGLSLKVATSTNPAEVHTVPAVKAVMVDA